MINKNSNNISISGDRSTRNSPIHSRNDNKRISYSCTNETIQQQNQNQFECKQQSQQSQRKSNQCDERQEQQQQQSHWKPRQLSIQNRIYDDTDNDDDSNICHCNNINFDNRSSNSRMTHNVITRSSLQSRSSRYYDRTSSQRILAAFFLLTYFSSSLLYLNQQHGKWNHDDNNNKNNKNRFFFVKGQRQLQTSRSENDCTLPCKNSGVCMKGKDHISADGSVLQQPLHQQIVKTNYCSCPTGYTGAYCEIKYIMCPNPDGKIGICTNGNACQYATTDFGDVYYHCECDIHGSDLSTPYARQFCRHAGTVFCSLNADLQSKENNYKKSLGTVSSSFCMNGGKCVEPDSSLKGTHHAGCICPNDWSGPHCETPTKSNPLLTEPDQPDPNFIHAHLHNLFKNRGSGTTAATTYHHRSFASYLLSFLITFLLIFTAILLAYWIYISYFQRRTSNNVLAFITGGGGGFNNTASTADQRQTSRSNNSRKNRNTNGTRRTASERARIPRREGRSHEDSSNQMGYISPRSLSSSSQRQRRQHQREQGGGGGVGGLPMSEIELT